MDEDQHTINFLDVYNSPAKSDASSLDIYDGLDTAALPEDLPEFHTPSRECLDLYEEIITEEVAAKEATFSDLQSEYENCQKQMKLLISKFKDIQSQNTSLQNENQCLKKNISALIKTARVEITRKQEKIDQLTQSLYAAPRRHSTVAIPSLLSGLHLRSPQETIRQRDPRQRDPDTAVRTDVRAVGHSSENNTQHGDSSINIPEKEKFITSRDPKANFVDHLIRTEAQSIFSDGTKCGNFSKNTSEKDKTFRSSGVKNAKTEIIQDSPPGDVMCNHSNKSHSEKEKISDTAEIRKPSTSKLHNVKPRKESSESHLQVQMSEDSPEATVKAARKDKETEYRLKDDEQRQRKEERQFTSSITASERGTFDLRERLQNSSKRRKSESGQENAIFDMNYESGHKKYSTPSTRDKSDTSSCKTRRGDDPGSQDKVKATCEKSKRERETAEYTRDRSTERRKSIEKDYDQLRKSKRKSVSCLKDESYHSSAKCEFTDRRNHCDSDRKEKPPLAYNKDLKSSSSTSKDSNSSSYLRDEKSTSKNKNGRDKSAKHDRDRDSEKKRYREDHDPSKYERKEQKVHKEKEKFTEQSPNKRKRTKLSRSEQKTDNSEGSSTVDVGERVPDDKEPNTQKDLKLSFMQTLNLTLSPVKKGSQSEIDTSMKGLPESKEILNSSISEVRMDSPLNMPRSLGHAEEKKVTQCLDDPPHFVPKTSLCRKHSGGFVDAVSKLDEPEFQLEIPVHFVSNTDVTKPNSNIRVNVVSKLDTPNLLTDGFVDTLSKVDVPIPYVDNPMDADSKSDDPNQLSDIHMVAVSKASLSNWHSDRSVEVVSKHFDAKHRSDKPGDTSKPDAEKPRSNSPVDVVSKTDVPIQCSDSSGAFSKMNEWKPLLCSPADAVSESTVPEPDSDNSARDASKTDIIHRHCNSPVNAALKSESSKPLVDSLVSTVSKSDETKLYSASTKNATSKSDAPKQLSDVPEVVISKTNVTKPHSGRPVDVVSKDVAAEPCTDSPVDGLSKRDTQKLLLDSSSDAGSKKDVPSQCPDNSVGSMSEYDLNTQQSNAFSKSAVLKLHLERPMDALSKIDARKLQSDGNVNAVCKPDVHKQRSDSHVDDVPKTDAPKQRSDSHVDDVSENDALKQLSERTMGYLLKTDVLNQHSDSPVGIVSKRNACKPHSDRPMDATPKTDSTNKRSASPVDVLLKPSVQKLQSDSHVDDVPKKELPKQRSGSHVANVSHTDALRQLSNRPVDSSDINVVKKGSGRPGSKRDSRKQRSDKPAYSVSKSDTKKWKPDRPVDVLNSEVPNQRSDRFVESESKIVPKQQSNTTVASELKINVLMERSDRPEDILSKRDSRKLCSVKPVDATSKNDTPKQQSCSPADSNRDYQKRQSSVNTVLNDAPNRLPTSSAVSLKDSPKHRLGASGESKALPYTNEVIHIDLTSEYIAFQPTGQEDVLQTPADKSIAIMPPTLCLKESENQCPASSQANETDSFIDLEELGSFIEIDKCSGCDSPLRSNSSKENIVDLCQEDTDIVDNKPEVANANKSKSSIYKRSKEYSYDANTGKSSMLFCKELNKENCQPEAKSGTACGKFSPILVSSDELEEGEIISDDEEEPIKEEKPKAVTIPIPHTTAEHVKSPPTTAIGQRDMARSISPARGISTPKQFASKTKEKSKNKTKKKDVPVPNNMSKNVNNVSCLEGIVNIVPPSTVEDVLQMLKCIRMHMRCKYMKFKVQVAVQPFNKVIENGSLHFRTLVESLDWSAISSEPESLKKSICKCIESKLKQVKKNGIVDRIFEQHLVDMKKKLWKFVDDQLDSLFDTLKTMLVKLCDRAKPELDGNKSKSTAKSKSDAKGPSAPMKGPRNSSPRTSNSHLSSKLFGKELCSRQRPFEKKNSKNIPSSKQACFPSKKLTIRNDVVKDAPVKDDGRALLNTGTLSPVENPFDQLVSSSSDHYLKNTSGLSFNLVSDDHMGDLFKSLLNDPDDVQENNVQDENAWICTSPAKNSLEQKCTILSFPAEEATPVKAALEQLPSSWPLSPPSLHTLSSFNSLIHPDVLDESCMLEIPSSTSFKSFESLEDQAKSFGSILMDDLAVSLTVPSPLKSDSHLSFLRASSVLESAHDSAKTMITQYKDAQLEEEDASEQDIHLTLDSENSSSCSSPATNDPPAFQCLPSEPMQAVIMEKSNDHFIVKIRRAVSSNSPASDGSPTEHTDSGLFPLEDKEIRAFFEATHGSFDTVQKTTEKEENATFSHVHAYTDIDLVRDVSEKTEDRSVQPQFLANSNTPERKETGFKSLEDQRLDTLAPTGISDYCSASENSIERTEAMHISPGNLEPDQLSTRALPNLTIAEGSDINRVRKRKKSSDVAYTAKRRRTSPSLITETEHRENQHVENPKEAVLAGKKNLSKHKHSASDGTVKRSTRCSKKNLSAKNVVKKKGEVVVSWTREEDRAILLECQKRVPTEKTFLSLAMTLKKYPYQIEERFKQLLKLFKKANSES